MSLTKMAKLSMSIADITCCAICLESFTRPKMLPCQHTYCYCCLLSLCPNEEQTQITCPQCREIHNIPTGGISNFRDNIMANNLLEVGAMKEEVLCSDCELRPAVSECEHCDSNICAQCLVEHIKLSMELKMSLKDVQENLAMPKSDVKKEKLKTSKEELGKQLGVLKHLQKMELQKLAQSYRESATLESFIGIIGQVYDELSNGDSDDSYCASLTQKLDKCTTVQSLKDLKSHVSDLKTVVRLLQSSDDDLRFVPGQDSDQFGHLEIGQAVLNLRGKYESDISLDGIFQLFPELRRKFEQNQPNLITTDKQSLRIRHARDVEDSDVGEAGAQQIEPGWEKDNEADDIDRIKARTNAQTKSSLTPDVPEEQGVATGCGCVQESAAQQFSDFESSTDREYAPSVIPEQDSNPLQNQLPRNVNYRRKNKGRVQIIGRGKYFDESEKLRGPRGVAYHVTRHEIFVADTENNRIMAYGRDNGTSRVFCRVDSPGDLAISSDGLYVYIVVQDRFIKVALDGRNVYHVTSCSLGPFQDCCSIACYKEFTVLVSGADDFHCLFIFDSDGREIRHFGGKHLKGPSGIGISQDGTMYVTDDNCRYIKVFRWNGQYMTAFLEAEEDAAYGDAVVDGDDVVCVVNRVINTIDVYDQSRARIARIGERSGKKWAYGRMSSPFALAFMPDGQIIVADQGNNRLQIYN